MVDLLTEEGVDEVAAAGGAAVAVDGGRRERDRHIGERLAWARGVAEVQGWDGRWIRNLSDVAAVEHGCWFCDEAAEEVCEFVELFCRHYKGGRAGESLELCAWQRDYVVKPIFGWLRPDGTRRIRTAYIEVPRKNGKSTLAAAIALYLLVADGEMGASIVGAAADKDQAKEVFKSSVQMVKMSEDLRKVLKVYRDSIACEETASAYVVISAEADTKHGRDDSGVIFDELHAQPNDKLWNVLKGGVGSRRQPIVFVITTAGDEKESVCYEQHERAIAILRNEKVDDAFYGFIAAADDGDDWWRLETLIRANPALELEEWIDYEVEEESGRVRVKLSAACPFWWDEEGYFDTRTRGVEGTVPHFRGAENGDSPRGVEGTVPHFRGAENGDSPRAWDGAAIEAYVSELTRFVRRHPEHGLGAVRLDNLIDELREAVDSNTARARWKWLHLNLWEQASYGWMEGWRWDRCGLAVDRAALRGRTCYGGLDLASKIDMTAFVLVFPPAARGERWQFLPWYWVPVETAKERSVKDKVPYLDWIERGLIQTTGGFTADYDVIGRDIQGLRGEFRIKNIGYDPWNALQLATQLEGFGYQMVETPQTLKWMSDPMKELEAKVLSEQVAHGGHPVLRWNVLNCVARMDANGNVRPDKEKSREKIDGLVALIMGLGRAIAAKGTRVSSYDEGDDEPLSF